MSVEHLMAVWRKHCGSDSSPVDPQRQALNIFTYVNLFDLREAIWKTPDAPWTNNNMVMLALAVADATGADAPLGCHLQYVGQGMDRDLTPWATKYNKRIKAVHEAVRRRHRKAAASHAEAVSPEAGVALAEMLGAKRSPSNGKQTDFTQIPSAMQAESPRENALPAGVSALGSKLCRLAPTMREATHCCTSSCGIYGHESIRRLSDAAPNASVKERDLCVCVWFVHATCAIVLACT